jgi:hypothetical protein
MTSKYLNDTSVAAPKRSLSKNDNKVTSSCERPGLSSLSIPFCSS